MLAQSLVPSQMPKNPYLSGEYHQRYLPCLLFNARHLVPSNPNRVVSKRKVVQASLVVGKMHGASFQNKLCDLEDIYRHEYKVPNDRSDWHPFAPPLLLFATAAFVD